MCHWLTHWIHDVWADWCVYWTVLLNDVTLLYSSTSYTCIELTAVWHDVSVTHTLWWCITWITLFTLYHMNNCCMTWLTTHHMNNSLLHDLLCVNYCIQWLHLCTLHWTTVTVNHCYWWWWLTCCTDELYWTWLEDELMLLHTTILLLYCTWCNCISLVTTTPTWPV